MKSIKSSKRDEKVRNKHVLSRNKEEASSCTLFGLNRISIFNKPNSKIKLV